MNDHLTEIVYILDRSGSMASITESAIMSFNLFLRDQLEAPGEARLTLVLFDNEILIPHHSAPLDHVPPLDTTTFVPRGGTALLDAIGTSINSLGERLANSPEDERPGQVIVAIFTDGHENASTHFDNPTISKMIRHQEEHYQWEFLFLAAHQDAITTATLMGIKAGNAASVAFSDLGMTQATASFSRKTIALRNKGALNQDLGKSMEDIVHEESKKSATS